MSTTPVGPSTVGASVPGPGSVVDPSGAPVSSVWSPESSPDGLLSSGGSVTSEASSTSAGSSLPPSLSIRVGTTTNAAPTAPAAIAASNPGQLNPGLARGGGAEGGGGRGGPGGDTSTSGSLSGGSVTL